LLNPYLADILAQPGDLEHLIAALDLAPLTPLASDLRAGRFDRIILSGMGGSLHAGNVAWTMLAQAGLPVMLVDAAELLHTAPALITPRTLLILISQSGRSAEIVELLARPQRPAALIAVTNEAASPLAQAAAVTLPLFAGQELTVSTRTYVNTLAVLQLMSAALLGQDLEAGRAAIAAAAAAISAYLDPFEARVTEVGRAIGAPERLAVVGRGASLAAVGTGALILGEASKHLALSMNAAEFRHGPLELADSRLTILVFGGAPHLRELNLRLARDLHGYGVHVVLLDVAPPTEAPFATLTLPAVSPTALPLAEIIPIQLATVALARQAGLIPGHFVRSSKVTTQE
jgi:glucosamine--fructose-6-phosphate aminotransferase (isomerizing)